MQCSIYCSCTILLYYYYYLKYQGTDFAMQYILLLNNIFILLLSFKYQGTDCAMQYIVQLYNIVILLLSFGMPRYRLCNAVYTAAVQYCYIIIIIRNAKVQPVQCSIYCSCTIFLYYYYHSECQCTDCAMQYTLQLNNIVILLLSFGMPKYSLCNAVYTAAVQHCYIIIIIRNAKVQAVQCSIYCSCTIFLYYYYHSECQGTDCATQYILQLYNIVILFLSFKMPWYRLCNAVYNAAVQYCYIIIII